MRESSDNDRGRSMVVLWQEKGEFHLLAPDAPPIMRETRDDIQEAIRHVIRRLKPAGVGPWLKIISRCGQTTWAKHFIYLSPLY